MKLALFTVVSTLALGAQAHFRLLYPAPRGEFVADKELDFCGGYPEATANRTAFPLSNGFFRIKQGHPDWAASVLISVKPDAKTFDDFKTSGNDVFLRYWANQTQTGNFCIPLDVASMKIPGAVDGANVTIQVVLSGGDGQLYQCADLTLSDEVTLSADVQAACKNETDPTTDHGASSTSTTPGAASTGSSGNNGLGNLEHLPLLSALGAGVLGALVAVVSV
ncbi:hypothetical protein DFP72DRAFT_1150974 [Ephemerocybe angulata]|uniref:Copper acquisition factor BIM1-like domain-containing protein n=1 Tax=Ephemerocybe angulata TaxID=980116 RepID=A0A8H6MDU7_9AGAR|nr:hypothetical protein DFP72DRAFT_1150974 [Tulosesus angulatus]